MNTSSSIEKLPNIHPGEILRDEFLGPLQISQYRLAKATQMPESRISDIVRGKRRITAETALCLSKFLGTTAVYWLRLQEDYDLEEANEQMRVLLEQIQPFSAVPKPE